MALALVVEDDPLTQQMLSDLLPALGHSVLVAGSGRECLRLAEVRRPDVILLDLGLPDVPGTSVITELRRWTDTPIVVVSGSRQVRRKADALDAGADDFIDKPFDVSELRARLNVVERRLDSVQQRSLTRTFGSVHVDYSSRRVHIAGREVRLTDTEWLILEVLSREPGRVVTHRWLTARVWGPHAGTETHQAMRAHVKSLRAKLGDDARSPIYIRTETGVGYRWVSTPATTPATGIEDLEQRFDALREEVRRWADASLDDPRATHALEHLLDAAAGELRGLLRRSDGRDS